MSTNIIRRAFTGFAAAIGGGAAGFIVYDRRTCHPMRQMAMDHSGYQWKEAWIRFSNLIRPTVMGLPVMNIQQLAHYDGDGDKNSPDDDDRRIYFSSDGYVWDVTGSEIFQQSYGQWKGKEASVALAKMSLNPEDINRTDWESLTESDWDSLRSWTRYFREKYLIVGQLKEFTHKRH